MKLKTYRPVMVNEDGYPYVEMDVDENGSYVHIDDVEGILKEAGYVWSFRKAEWVKGEDGKRSIVA